MVLGVGIDIVQISRVSREIAGSRGFREMCFSPGEIASCRAGRGGAGSYAARFAAKEAFFKALGTGFGGGLSLKSVEVVNNRRGRPGLKLRGGAKELYLRLGGRRIHVSLTHGKDCAGAMVVIER